MRADIMRADIGFFESLRPDDEVVQSLCAEARRLRRGLDELRSAADQADVEYRAEIDRLREAIRRLAEQDATLSVCDGAVTVTMDATLTDAEREAIEWAVRAMRPECRAVLQGLLDRTK